MQIICYRIVTENFADQPGQRWPVEVLIQTKDPADIADFDAATEEMLDRIQERIDRQEDRGVPDDGYLATLRDKLGASNCTDWEEYCCHISQPEVFLRKDGSCEDMNVAEVAGRERMRRLMGLGLTFDTKQIGLLRRLERQAAVGRRVGKTKKKRLKPRVRPALTFACVRLDPAFTGQFDDDTIRNFLDAHRRSYDSHDWSPYKAGFSSTLVSDGRPGMAIHCLTVFLEGEFSVTFAALVPFGGGLPDDHALMSIATEEFRWDRSRPQRRGRKVQLANN